ncbi:trypsin-like peptidase domain-containing protein [Variovorax rhizosphaerae]|uniref:Trypsin-like peptidase domain-containing protein n=1 Tax=Variovorax rhizosphaerae TaxID=1836200 RepID=A0ABU8WXC0_9BURK
MNTTTSNSRTARNARRPVLLAALATAALLSLTEASAQAQRGAATPLSPQAVFEQVSPSVWVLQATDAQGRVTATGSAVATGPGTAITSCGLLAKAAAVALRRENVSYGATLEFPDLPRGLCQLRVANLPASAMAVVPVRELAVGMALYTVGAPRGKELTLGLGMLGGVRRADDGTLQALQLAAAPEAGLEGAALFDAQGRLAGLLGARTLNGSPSNLAMPATWIAEVPARGRVALAGLPVQAPAGTAPAAAGTTGPAELRVLEYTLREDRTTRKVVYRLDESTPERRSFNNGGWIEKPDGEVISVSAPIAGEFDVVMPPGGWIRGDLADGSTWSTAYRVDRGGTSIKMDLRATVVERSTMTVAGRELKVVQVDYRGHTQRGAGATLNNAPSGVFRASAWWSPELARVVRFEARTQGGNGGNAFRVDETLELVDWR